MTEQPTTDHDHTNGHGYISAKDDYLKRLRRIEGQARGLQRMVEDEKYCIDILTQVSAMTKALQAPHLPLDATQALEVVVLGHRVARHATHSSGIPWRGISPGCHRRPLTCDTLG